MEQATTAPQRIVDPDGAAMEVFPLALEDSLLRDLLTTLFRAHWRDIVFGPIIEGAAFEFRAAAPPERMGYMDGYLTVHFGPSHFHLCIGPHRGTGKNPTPPALARHRRAARVELFRRLDSAGGKPVSWGLRLFNGAGEQQISIFFPNPFLSADLAKVLAQPDWSRLALWDLVRARWLGHAVPDPADRAGTGFRHV